MREESVKEEKRVCFKRMVGVSVRGCMTRKEQLEMW